MFKIRPEQMLLFSNLARKRFEDQMVTHMQTRLLKTDNPSDSKIRDQIVFLIKNAENNQINYEDDIKHFIELFFHLSPEIFQNAEVNFILKATDASSSTKVAFLDEFLNSN